MANVGRKLWKIPALPRSVVLPLGRRRPGQAEARLDRAVVVDVLLHAVADAGAERQALADADVVLEVERRPGG